MKASEREIEGAAADPDFETYTISEVTESEDVNENGEPYYSIGTEEHTGFGLDGKYGIVPKVGNLVKMWTMQGSLIRGISINDKVAFYNTVAEARVEQERKNADNDAKKFQDWQNDVDERKTKFQTSYAELPTVFQDRIEKFQSTNTDFDWQFGDYEMMVCVDAVKIAEWAQAQDDPSEAVSSFDPSSEQMDELGLQKGHSGNSFGFAKRLAYHYVTDSEVVVLEHGALTPLVGCIDYGCPHPYFYGSMTEERYNELAKEKL